MTTSLRSSVSMHAHVQVHTVQTALESHSRLIRPCLQQSADHPRSGERGCDQLSWVDAQSQIHSMSFSARNIAQVKDFAVPSGVRHTMMKIWHWAFVSLHNGDQIYGLCCLCYLGKYHICTKHHKTSKQITGEFLKHICRAERQQLYIFGPMCRDLYQENVSILIPSFM